MLHPATEIRYINDITGHGVFAKAFIPAGTITWAHDELDREYTPTQVEAMPAVTRENFLTYTYRNSKGNFVLLWDHTRYMNHSFTPNCMATAYNFEVAICDIHPGDQLTNDYGTLNILEEFEPENEGLGRNIVKPDDLLHYHKDWDAQLLSVFPKIATVPQPLELLLSQDLWEEINAIAKGEKEMVSLLANYCR